MDLAAHTSMALTVHGFPLTMSGDLLTRVCGACGKVFSLKHGEPVSRFTGLRKDGKKADRPPRRHCSQTCAAIELGESRVGVPAMQAHWMGFHAARTEKRCSQCHGTFSIEEFRLNRKQRKFRGECRKCRNANTVKLYAKPGRYLGVIVSAAKTRARKNGLPFELTRDWALERLALQGWLCHYSGVPLTMGGGNKAVCPTNASIDRIDPALGYTRDNVVFCAAAINVAKNIWTINDLLGWADKIRAWRSADNTKEIIP